METARSTGIILDSVYTAKAARGMVEELNKNPARFKGNKILFIHTGTCEYIYIVSLLMSVGTRITRMAGHTGDGC